MHDYYMESQDPDRDRKDDDMDDELPEGVKFEDDEDEDSSEDGSEVEDDSVSDFSNVPDTPGRDEE